MGRWVGVPLEPAVLIGLLTGHVPLPPEGVPVQLAEDRGPHLVFTHNGVTERVWVTVEGLPARVEFQDGRQRVLATFARTVSGQLVGVNVEAPARSIEAEVRYLSGETLVLPAGTFELRIPAGTPIERVDRHELRAMLAFSVLERGRRLTVRARAKVNLGLEVLSRRADGYHELLTLLSAVDLADRLIIEITSRDRGAAPISLTCRRDAGCPRVPTTWPGGPRTPCGARSATRRRSGSISPRRSRSRRRLRWPVGRRRRRRGRPRPPVGREIDRRTAASARHGPGMDVPFFLGSGAALRHRAGRAAGTGAGPGAAPPGAGEPGLPARDP